MIVIDAAPGALLPEAITVVIVEVADVAFAVPARLVERVTPPLLVTPLPLVPDFVDGLVGLGGAILPQIDLRRRLALSADHRPEGEGGEGEIMVMVAAEGNYALRVDHVLSLATLEGDTVQVFDMDTSGAGALLEGVSAAMIVGEFPWRGRTVLLLDTERVGLPELGGRGGGLMPAGEGRIGAIGSSVSASPRGEAQHVYIVARVGAGRYALPVEQVAEVVAAGSITPIPGASPEVLGLIQLRGRPLPVLMPAALVGGGDESGEGAAMPGGGSGILVVAAAAAGRFALRVDAVIGIQRFPLSRIHAGAEVGGGGVEGRAGYLIDAADRVVGLLDADRLVASAGALAWHALLSPTESGVLAPVQSVASRSLLVVRIGGEWYALEALAVLRLVGWRPPMAVPASEVDLAGLVEIGADVLPVIDLRAVLGASVATDETTAMVVVQHGGNRWALVVDRIDRLVTVAEAALQVAEAPLHPLATIITQIGDRLISVLDLGPLFERN